MAVGIEVQSMSAIQRSPSAVRMNVRPGRLPDLWNRSVHYFANVLEMFFGNDAQSDELQQRVGGVESHGGRFVPILNLMFHGEGENFLYVRKTPDPILSQYFQNLGLTLPKVGILSREEYFDQESLAQRIVGIGPEWIDGYVTDTTLDQLSRATDKRTVSSYEASRLGNNKGMLNDFLEERGLPTFTTFYAKNPEEVDGCLRRLHVLGFRSAVVKSVIGASGIGMQRVSTSQLERVVIPESFFFEGPCMVQGWLDATRDEVKGILSPSVQVFLKDDAISFFDITEQFLSSESIFKGNECPPSYLDWPDHSGIREELLRQAGIVTTWLHDRGFRGPASIDYLVTLRRNDFEVYVCEANARVTGATYPSLLARHFHEGGAWIMRNLKFEHPMPTSQLLNVLSRHDYLYEPGTERGLLPYNLYTCEKGRVEQGQFLVMAPEIVTCKGLLIESERDLPIDWKYERA